MTLQPDSIVFADADVPDMAAGTYDVAVTYRQTAPATEEHTTSTTLHVVGPRFGLDPSWIESRFPPPAAAPHAPGVLPHVVLTRSSLPWERRAVSGSTDAAHPWLAVLLLTAAEIAGDRGLPGVQEEQVPFGTLRRLPPGPTLPDLLNEVGPADDQPVRVVGVPRALLKVVLPRVSWLGHLAHVRERFVCTAPGVMADTLDKGKMPDDLPALLARHGAAPGGAVAVRVEVPEASWRIEGDRPLLVSRPGREGELSIVEDARAVVLGSRVAVSGHYRAYLISVENRYSASGFGFDADGVGLRDLVRFVALDSWEFEVSGTEGRLEGLLRHLAGTTGPVGLPAPVGDHMTGPGVPMLRAGYALLPHRRRTGGHLRSWYRGPLVAHRDIPPLPEPPHDTADALLLEDRDTGMLITSYAAAWELGRTIVAADPAVGKDLVRWRADRHRHAHRAASGLANPHLPAQRRQAPDLPSSVRALLRDLAALQGVPFGYLVPDPAMLRPESMRVFRLDPVWLRALLDGALSAGRPLTASLDDEAAYLAAAVRTAGTDDPVSGCLIRSEVVSGWPAIHVDAFAGNARLPHLRRAALSDSVLLVLFRGDAEHIDVHPNPEALHHGVQLSGLTWSAAAPQVKGGQLSGELSSRHVLDVDVASQGLGPDAFAVRLIAGVPRLSVTLG